MLLRRQHGGGVEKELHVGGDVGEGDGGVALALQVLFEVELADGEAAVGVREGARAERRRVRLRHVVDARHKVLRVDVRHDVGARLELEPALGREAHRARRLLAAAQRALRRELGALLGELVHLGGHVAVEVLAVVHRTELDDDERVRRVGVGVDRRRRVRRDAAELVRLEERAARRVGERDADDAQCKALELSGGFITPKNPVGKALLRGGFTHHKAFDAKATQFPESHVLVVVDTAPPPGEPDIVGAVMLGLKRATLRGRSVLLGYTFDLRVHEKAQRQGLASMLCAEVESRCIAAGVHTSYLSVNSDNPRAIALYEKLGYTLASRRAPQMVQGGRHPVCLLSRSHLI